MSQQTQQITQLIRQWRTGNEQEFAKLYELVNWEQSAAGGIYEGFVRFNLSNVTLESTYCRGLTCRIEVSYEDTSEYEKLLTSSEPLVRWAHKGLAYQLNEGEGIQRSTIYLTKL